MKYNSWALLVLWSLMVSISILGCSEKTNDPGGDLGEVTQDSGLNLAYSNPPINLLGISARFAADISYGSASENVFDVFLMGTPSNKVPLVVYIHGGGFTGGDKSNLYNLLGSALILSILQKKISFASINYRLLSPGDTQGVIKSLNDSKRCLQFIKHYADELNIDKNKIVLMGESAGAGTSLWLALSDDMADSNNIDPILRESTRVQGAVAVETQATYDLLKWESIFASYNFDLSSQSNAVQPFYGMTSYAQINSESIVAYRQKIDFLGLMDSNDPEIWVNNSLVPEVPPIDTSILYHHPYHAKAIKDQAESVGLAGIFYIPALGIDDPSGENITDFVARKLN